MATDDKVHTNVRQPRELWLELRAEAIRQGKTKDELLEEILRDQLED